MGLIAGIGYVFGAVILYAILYLIGERKDKAQQRGNKKSNYTMRIKRTKQVGPIPLAVFFYSAALFFRSYLSENMFVEFFVSQIILFSFAIAMTIYILYMAMWKVVVEGERFEVFGLLKKRKCYSFSDIYIVTVTNKMVANSIERRVLPVYDVFVGESDALKKLAFTVYENAVSYDLFVGKIQEMGRIKKRDSLLG